MKKNTARILALVLAAVMVCALFVACAASKPDGTYKVKTINGKSMKDYMSEQAEAAGYSLEDMLSMIGIKENELNDMISFTFKSDGTGTASMKMLGMNESADFTWELKGKDLTVTANGKSETVTFENNTISFSSEGQSFVLGK